MSAPARSLVILACACLTVGLAFGSRQSFGLFVVPVSSDLGWGREAFSLVVAVQALLNGIAAPLAGAIADRWGAWRAVASGGVLYATGLALMSASVTPLGMIVGGGLLAGMGLSACGLPILLSVVARHAPESRRSLWLGLVTTGATAGQLALIPVVRYTIASNGWVAALLVLAACAALIVPLALCLAPLEPGTADRSPTS